MIDQSESICNAFLQAWSLCTCRPLLPALTAVTLREVRALYTPVPPPAPHRPPLSSRWRHEPLLPSPTLLCWRHPMWVPPNLVNCWILLKKMIKRPPLASSDRNCRAQVLSCSLRRRNARSLLKDTRCPPSCRCPRPRRKRWRRFAERSRTRLVWDLSRV